MTLPHIIYIPFLLTVGFVLGWALGSRAMRSEWERAEKRRREREGA